MGDRRWTVETTYDGVHDVGADTLEVRYGTLTFRDADGAVLVAYGPGFWRAVAIQ